MGSLQTLKDNLAREAFRTTKKKPNSLVVASTVISWHRPDAIRRQVKGSIKSQGYVSSASTKSLEANADCHWRQSERRRQ